MNAVIKRVCLSAVTLALLANGGPLFAQSALTPEQLTLRVERLTELSQRSEAKLSTVQEQLKTLSEEMGRMGRLIDNRAVVEMIQQVDQISEDVSLLRGLIEVQGNDVIDIKKRQRELYQDIDRRLRDLESRSVGQAPASQGTVPQVSAPAQPAVEPAGSAALVPSLAPAVGAPATTSAPVTPTQAGEQEAYQAAFDTLKEGRYKEAKVALQAFLDSTGSVRHITLLEISNRASPNSRKYSMPFRIATRCRMRCSSSATPTMNSSSTRSLRRFCRTCAPASPMRLPRDSPPSVSIAFARRGINYLSPLFWDLA
jgi:TolA-binding protein